MNVAVVGAGPVGVASAVVYALSGHRVVLVERAGERLAALRSGRLPFHEEGLARAWVALAGAVDLVPDLGRVAHPGAVVVCVGTPSGAEGAADLSQVEAVLGALDGVPPTVVVMRSTVPPGTGRRLAARLAPWGHGYAAHPEFLQEGTALEDSLRPTRVVIGADVPAVADLVAALAPGLGRPCLRVDVPTAEFIKIAANAHLAMRVSFINEMAQLCERLGADIQRVAEGVGMDPRIGPAFLRAGLGYGGSCFPKDTRALSALGRRLDADLPLLAAVIAVNARQPQRCVARLAERLGGLQGRRVGVWGLAFKPGTDDVRESQALRLVEELAARKAVVRVHDPLASAAVPLPPGVQRVDDPLRAASGAEAVVLATEWPLYRTLDPLAVAAAMEAPRVLLDARNALAPEPWAQAGVEYRGVGRPQAASLPALGAAVRG